MELGNADLEGDV